MSEEDLLEQEIMSDAQKRVERTIKRAQAQADAVRQAAREEAEAHREAIMEKARVRAEEEARSIQARTEQELEKDQLRAIQDVLGHIRDEAWRRIERLPGEEQYGGVLVRLALRAIENMRGDKFQILLSEDDRARWGARLPGQIADAVKRERGREVEVELSDEKLDARGGLVVRSADGRQLADQTFPRRLERLWDQLRVELAGMLPDSWERHHE